MATPAAVWSAYWEQRRKYEGEEIESVYQASGFEFDCGATKDFKALVSMAEAKLRVLEKQRADYREGMLCGYADYSVLIDLDAKTISGLESYNYEGLVDPFDEDFDEDEASLGPRGESFV